MLHINDIIIIDNEYGKVLAISYSEPTFYYIETKSGSDWYCELDLIEEEKHG